MEGNWKVCADCGFASHDAQLFATDPAGAVRCFDGEQCARERQQNLEAEAYRRARLEAEEISREDLEATSAWLSRMLERHGHAGL